MIKRGIFLVAMGISGMAMASEPMNLDVATQIRQEAFHHSQVMDTVTYLTETIGPRLSVSPSMTRAGDWTRDQLKAWGLANAHKEAFADFGRGWEFSNASVQMVSPRAMPLRALPRAWTPGTNGTVAGEAMRVSIESIDDLAQYKGKLRGKVLLLDEVSAYERLDKPDSQRFSEADFADMHTTELPEPKADDAYAKRIERHHRRNKLLRERKKFFVREGVVAIIGASNSDDGILKVAGDRPSRKAGEPAGVPSLVMATEHYNALVRAVERDQSVKLRINVKARFTDQTNQPGHNTIAEIPGHGSDSSEVVMLGAHLDSWHTGTGASDNAAGVAVMMEAMRILKAIGVKPNRTIRVALWGGEEQGLVGSRAYVAKHFAAYAEPTDPEQKKLPPSLRKPVGELQTTREYERLSVYFNLDNGSGRIRGIYGQHNMAAMPIFAKWLQPFHDLGATEVPARDTGSTDHVAFEHVGLPGFQFIQDRLDYFTHVHHTNLDTLDHVEPDDLKQAAAVVAWFAYQAAMREDKMPRKPFLRD